MAHYIYALASILGLLSFVMFNILHLRIMYFMASFLFVVSGIMFQNHSMTAWSTCYILINGVQIFLLILAKRPILLPKNLKKIYPFFAPYMQTRQFSRACKIAEIKQIKVGEHLVKQGQTPKNLYLIIDGKFDVTLDEKNIATLNSGDFIGEMSYITKRSPNADVFSSSPSTVLVWSIESLKKLKKEKNTLYMCFRLSISSGISRKLEESTILLSKRV